MSECIIFSLIVIIYYHTFNGFNNIYVYVYMYTCVYTYKYQVYTHILWVNALHRRILAITSARNRPTPGCTRKISNCLHSSLNISRSAHSASSIFSTHIFGCRIAVHSNVLWMRKRYEKLPVKINRQRGSRSRAFFHFLNLFRLQ